MGRLISLTPEVTDLLAQNAPVGIGTSGGKDSCALAFAVLAHLREIGHTGPRVLIHADLGRVEWQDSMATCRRLANATGAELVVVRRKAGDLMDRWLSRQANCRARYINLECVKLILPWSTPSMRFCTSELKSVPIANELAARFPGRTILSVAGIRAQESARRAKAPVAQINNRLCRKKLGTSGLDWHPIITWNTRDVFDYLAECRFPLHEAYRVFGSTRVSCVYCIMGSTGDLRAAATCAQNQGIYREMCELEITSTFSFQSSWLSDVAPHLLTPDQVARLDRAKEIAKARAVLEKRIPKRLEFTKGWPTFVPTMAEAELLAEVRQEMGVLLGIEVKYTTADSVRARYAELMAEKRGADSSAVVVPPVSPAEMQYELALA